jgi:hypothetical protein
MVVKEAVPVKAENNTLTSPDALLEKQVVLSIS